jgi:hypothetical protein
MDLTESIQPRSDQINSDDLVTGPQTYTIREVRQGAAEQPFDFMLVETERAYRPSKTMRRLIVAAWGSDASAYAGRRLTLYREPSIRFGKDVVGGIRISHMSHIAKRVEEKFQTTRGKRETFTVDPLPDAPAAPSLDGLDADGLRALWKSADPETRKAIEARVSELNAAEATS